MSIAITDDHRALAETARDFLATHKARAAARALLDATEETLPPFWDELARVGWLGLHVSEQYGGSGYGLPELVVVLEELGRAVAPGPFVPTVIASAIIADTAADEQCARLLPGLTDGSVVAGVGLGGELSIADGVVRGDAGVVLGGGLADIFVLAVGDDIIVCERGDGVQVEVPANFDPTRRSARLRLDGVTPVAEIADVRPAALALLRTLLAAEAAGVAQQCVDDAVEYAKQREQFGRVIAMFQAVKHHCANMLVAAECATAAVWDAARASTSGAAQFELTAAVAATLAAPAAYDNGQLNIQVHGGIGFTWEHDAHLLLRRAVAIGVFLDHTQSAADVTAATRAGVKRAAALELPPEADAIREQVRSFANEVKSLDATAQREKLIESGYAMPHWPKPWGRAADAVEQLVIDEEFAAANIARPQYGITGWVVLTMIQHGTESQVERWVRPTLAGDLIWCQLFSEPDAGSDAAGIKTRATRVDGGWVINGQKVWTSGAQHCHLGLATVRTDPSAPKHAGITTVVIDMKGPGVEVRPLRQPTGGSDFNEVFFNDVFVPDDDVVGAPNQGWTVARATLGNERVSIGGGAGGMMGRGEDLVTALDANPDRLPGGEQRVGDYLAKAQALTDLNLRRAARAVSGAEPGPEGNTTKLVLAEQGHEHARVLAELVGDDLLFTEGAGQMPFFLVFMSRAMSIAGGTSEITRNQIGERILGLPRDPLLA